MSAFARAAGVCLCLTAVAAAADPPPLPRFTEEREAAALHFVRKHVPEVVPLLDELKKANRAAYERQVRETFQVTELLADLQGDPRRYELELKIWKAENQAMVLVGKLATPKPEDRKAVEGQLETLARELVELELLAMEHQTAVLERELTAARDDLARARENHDRSVKDRYEDLLEKARRKRTP